MGDLGKVLDDMGFSPYKKKAYIKLVQLEQAGASELARKARIPSSKIYEILRWLHDNGYVSVVGERPLVYRANDPKSVLKSDVKSKMAELKRIESSLSGLTTGLAMSGRADFEIIKGREAFFKKVKEAVAKSDTSIVAVVKNWRLDYELRELTSEFVARGGKGRFLGPVSGTNRTAVKEWKKIGVLVKQFDPDTTRFTVWDGKTIAMGFKREGDRDYLSLWIENEYLGKILTEHFNSLWKK